MKRLLYIFLVCGLFVSCKSDDMEHVLSDRISSIEISAATAIETGTSATGLTYTFEYDESGRLKKVNDKVFYYGANGRVEFSRIERKVKDEYGEEEYVEHLSYHWDTQGRLKEVYLDRLYQKYSYDGEHHAWDQHQESSVENVLLAVFSYAGTNRKPASIRYREMSLDLSSPLVTLGKEEEIHYSYEGDNVVSVQLDGYLKYTQLGANPPIGLIPYRKEVSNTYLGDPHYLAKIYVQLGFHPYSLTEVVSANSMARSQSNIEIEGEEDGAWTSPGGEDINWTDMDTGEDTYIISPLFEGTITHSYRFNVLNLPTEIVGEGDGTLQRTNITYE